MQRLPYVGLDIGALHRSIVDDDKGGEADDRQYDAERQDEQTKGDRKITLSR